MTASSPARCKPCSRRPQGAAPQPAPRRRRGRRRRRRAGREPPGADDPIEDFQKVDLRVARVVGGRAGRRRDKLLRLTLDLGGETRNVFAGIKAAYEPEQLVGRLVVMVANLAPRKMSFGGREGMVLCARGDGSRHVPARRPTPAPQPGMQVK